MLLKVEFKSPEYSSHSIKKVTQTIQNETKEPRGEFSHLLLGTLGASLLRNMIADKTIMRTGDELHRSGQDF